MKSPKIRFKNAQGADFPDWSQDSLGSLCQMYQPATLSKQSLDESGPYAVYGANGIIGKHSQFNHAEAEVVVSCRGNCGSVQMTKPCSWINGNAMVVHPKDEKLLEKKFLNYLLSGQNFKSLTTGGAQPQITRGQLSNLSVFFPSCQEQQKIASFFSTLDQKIELNERKLEALEKLKKGVMQKFFKQELRFKSPENRDYPEWEVQKLEKLCSTFKSGSSITQKSIFEAGAYPVYGGNGLRGYTDTYTHDGEYALIGRQGALCGNLKYVKGKTYISEHAIAVQANSENSTQWLYYRLKEMNLNKLSESSAQPGLSAKKLKEILINTPCLEEQIRIANFLACFDEQIKLCTNKLFMLQQLKRSFLRQMFV